MTVASSPCRRSTSRAVVQWHAEPLQYIIGALGLSYLPSAVLRPASRRIGIPYGSSEKTCPVRSLQAWLETARIMNGAVFRSLDKFQRVQQRRLSDKAVARIVKRRAAAEGLDPGRYAGHSLRAGLATSAAAGGASERAIMNQTGHCSTTMVRRYIREANLFAPDNAASLAGL